MKPHLKIPARWVKVAKDIFTNLVRTILVILSIAVGVFAIGMTTNAGRIVKRDMNEQYLATNPDSATFYLSPFDESLLQSIQNARIVSQAEARRLETVEIRLQDGTWEELTLNAIPDFESIQINQIFVEKGTAAPERGEVFLERKTADYLNLDAGEKLQVRLPGTTRTWNLDVTGIVHDLHAIPPELLLQTNGYISLETLQWMGLGRWYNALLFTVQDNTYDKEYNMMAAGLLRDRIIQPAGYHVANIVVEPMGLAAGEHWANRDIGGLILILNFMGVMCIFLTIGLIINTISALMQQQIRQIGIIRLVGGLHSQVFWMYVVNVLVLALCALLLAIPLGVSGARELAAFAAGYININISRIDLPFSIALLQTAIGLLVPLAAAAVPILNGTSISVYDAVYQPGSIATIRQGLAERVLKKIRGLTSPAVLSVRNTFRNKSRLALTLVTLSLAGATFIAAPSTHKSILSGFGIMVRYWQYDASITIPETASIHTAVREARRSTGAALAEGWYQDHATFIQENGLESEAVEIMALPIDSNTVEPSIVSGRWFVEGDTDVLVVNEDLLDLMPHLHSGSEVNLHIQDVERDFRIIGVASRHIFGARVYVPYDLYTRLIGQQNLTNLVRVRISTDRLQDSAVQTRMAGFLEDHFEERGFGTGTSSTQAEMMENAVGSSSIILLVLLLMAVMLAVVGGLGLAGTMSLNVMERSREIGVLRAMGAANNSIRRLVLAEGLVVGGFSWLLGMLLSYPLGAGLSDAVTLAIMQTRTEFMYSFPGAMIWLVLILVITILACLLPARRASQLTVREVLAYE